MQSPEHILVTGATGNTGSVVADELLRRGVPLLAMARSERRRAELRARGIESVPGDFDDPASLERALAGVTRAYLVCTPDEGLVPRETAFIAAARRAGVRHIVKCSAYLAGEDAPSMNLKAHGRIERALVESGMSWTIIRPHGFMQTFTLFSWDMIQKAGVVSAPFGDGAMPLVDVRDVAKVAVKALTEPGHEGQAYDVTGPVALRFDEIAAILSRVLGKRVVYLPSSDRQMTMVSKLLGVTEVPLEHVLKIARLVREHRLDRVHDTLPRLGIESISYEQFVRDLVAGRTGGGNSFVPPDTLLVRFILRVSPAIMRWRVRLGGVPSLPAAR